MFYKKMILIYVLTFCLYAEEDYTKVAEPYTYSNFYMNDELSFYLGKMSTQYSEDRGVYSVGFLIHEQSDAKVVYGVGYVQPCSQVESILDDSIQKADEKQDGIHFHISYKF